MMSSHVKTVWHYDPALLLAQTDQVIE